MKSNIKKLDPITVTMNSVVWKVIKYKQSGFPNSC